MRNDGFQCDPQSRHGPATAHGLEMGVRPMIGGKAPPEIDADAAQMARELVRSMGAGRTLQGAYVQRGVGNPARGAVRSFNEDTV